MRIEDFTLTKHAIERALDMDLGGDEIRNCLLHPDDIRESTKYPGQFNYRAGRITCAVGDDRAVVTIVWSTIAAWKADLLEQGSYGGREYHNNPRLATA